MATNIKELDPVQGLLDYINDIKPYHSKVIEILTEYVYNEEVNVTFSEEFKLNVDLVIPTNQTFEGFNVVGGFGGLTPYGGPDSWPVIPPNITVSSAFDATYPGYDITNNTVFIPGDRTNQYFPGQQIIVDLFRWDTVNETRDAGVQTTYTISSSIYVPLGQIGGIANSPLTSLQVDGSLDDPAAVLPPLGVNEVYAAQLNLVPFTIDSVIGYDISSPTFSSPLMYTDVPPNTLTLNGALTGGETTVEVNETISLDTSTQGTILIFDGSEYVSVSYTNFSGTTFTGCSGTPAAANGANVLATHPPLPTIGSLPGTAGENQQSLIFVNSFVFNGNIASAFPQGFKFTVLGGSTVGDYTTIYSFYDSTGDKTYVRVFEHIDTETAFVVGDVQEKFPGYDDSFIDFSSIPVGLNFTSFQEKLVFSWSDPGIEDVIDGFQFFIKQADSGTDTFEVNGDITNLLSPGSQFNILGSTSNDGTYTVDSISGGGSIISVTGSVPVTEKGGWLENYSPIIAPPVSLDISLSTYTTNSEDISAVAGTNCQIAVAEDGTKLFAFDPSSEIIYEFSFNTPKDLSAGLTFTGNTLDVSSVGLVTSFTVSKSGQRLYIEYTSTNNFVKQYNLSTGWDLSTAVDSGHPPLNLTSAGVSNPFVIMVSNDGTKLYTTSTSGPLEQFSFSTPWEINVVPYDSINYDWDSEISFPRGGFFYDGGSILVMGDDSDDELVQFALTTPYDIGTASYDSKKFQLDTSLGGSVSVRHAAILDDGTKIYTSHSGVVYEFDTNV